MRSHPIRWGLSALALFLLFGCSPKIHGTVALVDPTLAPVANDHPRGTVVNMINTTERIEAASHSATVDEKGQFESAKDAIKPGTYKVETSRIGYETDTQTHEIGRFTSRKVEIRLKKIQEGKRATIQTSSSDEDKIVNPGEVNIQPPTL